MIKYIFTILLFIFCFSLYISSKEYKLNGINTTAAINKITYSQDKIALACTNGIIKLSSDKGITWKSIKVFPDSVMIVDIKFLNNRFIAWTNNNNIILSDEGEKWSDLKIDKFRTKDIVHNKFYYRLIPEGIVLKYDDEFNLVDTITIKPGYKPNEIYILNNNIIYSDSAELVLQNLSDDSKSTFSLSNFGARASNYKLNNNILYFLAGSNLLSFDGIKSPVFLNDSISYFEVVDNIVYQLDILSVGTYSKISAYEVKDNERTLLNNPLDTFAYNIFIPFDFVAIDYNTFIAVGSGNTILRSNNKCVNWKYISNINNYPIPPEPEQIIPINKDTIFFIADKNIYRTNNGGITWNSQNYVPEFKYQRSLGSGYLNAATGEGIFISNKNQPLNPNKNYNLLYTKNFGDSYSYHWYDIFNSAWSTPTLSIFELDTSFLVIGYNNTLGQCMVLINKSDRNYIRSTDKSKKTKIYKSLFNDGFLYGFGYRDTVDQNGKPEGNLYFFTSIDTGKTWIADKLIQKNTTAILPTNNNESVLAVLSNKSFYKLDLLTKEFKLVNIDSVNYAGWIKDKVYIWRDKTRYILENNDFDNPVLSPIIFSEPIILSEFYTSQKDDAMFALSRIYSAPLLMEYNIYKLTLEEGTPVAETQKVNKYLYISPSYPNPAKEYTKTTIAWDKSYSIDNASVEVYDMLQRRVSQASEIEIAHINDYVGEIRWDCSKVPAGLYFIKISAGSNTRTSAVTVVK